MQDMRINYLFDKGFSTYVSLTYKGRTYERKCEYYMGMYHFTFRSKYWSCYGRRY